jgi:AcrR family transcriptional regulator
MAPNALIDRSRSSELEQRVIEAMLECIGRWGVAKTTADDVARAAGVSRATLYRAFPGGKEVVFTAVLRHETERFFATVTDRLDDARTLEDAAVIGIVEAARFVTGHEALRYLLAHEPERILPAFAFHRLGAALAVATAATAPHLRRFVADDEAAAAGAEWVIRLLLSYALDPTPSVDLADEADVRRFVRTYVLPALLAPAPSVITTPPQEH